MGNSEKVREFWAVFKDFRTIADAVFAAGAN